MEDSVGSLQLVVVMREGRTAEGEDEGRTLYSNPRPRVLHFHPQLGLTPSSSTSLLIATLLGLLDPDMGEGSWAVGHSVSVMEPIHSVGNSGGQLKEPGCNLLDAVQGDSARKCTKASFEGIESPRGSTWRLPRIVGSRGKEIECGRGSTIRAPVHDYSCPATLGSWFEKP